ncbi:MAG: alginate export family protein [Bacteroidota bacterium]
MQLSRLRIFIFVIQAGFVGGIFAQVSKPTSTKPAFLTERADEDYSYLKDSSRLRGNDALKFIAFGESKNSYLSLGGSFRPRIEHFSNQFWTNNDLTYYSQKASLHAKLQLGKHLRIFGELYHGLVSGNPIFLQSDELDVHQAFIEFETSLPDHGLFSAKIGRQELKLGAGRLVDLRSGVNIRRAFDMGRISYSDKKWAIQAFYGKEVSIQFNAFDNVTGLFNRDQLNPLLWGVFTQLIEKGNKQFQGQNELYYLGFYRANGTFSDVTGEESRHSLGIRRSGNLHHQLSYNTELIFQFGSLGDQAIRAFSFETDWRYTFISANWNPSPGLKLDWSSGDAEQGDGRVNSFNPMFVNPAIYSLAAVNTPVNLTGIHPSILLFPHPKLLINFEYALYFRASSQDGLYIPPQILSRQADGQLERHIGDVIGLYVQFTANRYFSFDIRTSYFIPGSFIEVSGPSEPIFHIAPTATFMF